LTVAVRVTDCVSFAGSGDAVNVAARLEAETREYGTAILIVKQDAQEVEATRRVGVFGKAGQH
jgi:class 3 adenylate cyclase